MREGLLFPGVVLLVLMIVFAFAPLPNAPTGTVSQNYPLIVHPPAFPYSEQTPISLQWTGGTGNTWVQVLPCAQSNCSDVKPRTAVTEPIAVYGPSALGNGSQGALTIWVSTTESLLIVTNSSVSLSVTVTWNEMPEFGLLWEILTVVGILLAIGGMVLPERGAPRGHGRRLHYFHWRHHPFALPPHLPSAGLLCPGCGLADIPTEEDYCPRCHAPLPRASTIVPGPPSSNAPPPPRPARPRGPDMAYTGPGATSGNGGGGGNGNGATSTPTSTAAEAGAGAAGAAAAAAAAAGAPAKKRVAVNKTKVAGQSLSVADPDPLRPWRVMKGLGFEPAEALVFTREDPEILKENYHLEPSQVFIVSRSEGERTISPSESDRIADLADQHFRGHAGGVVILTDPNYFVTHGGFDMLRRLVLAIQDHARDQKGTFILGFNPGVFTPDQRLQLEERMRKVV